MKTLITLCIVLSIRLIGQTCTTPVTYSLTSTGESCTGCCDGSIQVTNLQGGCAAYYITINPGGQFSGSGNFQNLCSDNYTITVQDAGCCPAISYTTCVDFNCPTPTSIKSSVASAELVKFDKGNNKLYLDPASNFSSLKIFTIQGALIKETGLNPTIKSIDLQELTNGFYIIYLETNTNTIIRKKINKE